MGLDIFVMPIRKYFGGSYDSPLVRVLGENIDKLKRIGREKPDFKDDESSRILTNLLNALTLQANIKDYWNDQGETVLSLQYSRIGLSGLMAFAAFQDYPLAIDSDSQGPVDTKSVFKVGSDPNKHPSLYRIRDGAQTSFPHLILHSQTEGFYVPLDFECPVLWPDPDEWVPKDAIKKELMEQFEILLAMCEFSGNKEKLKELKKAKKQFAKEPAEKLSPRRNLNRIGSSQALLRELDQLNQILKMPRDWGDFKEGESVQEADESLKTAKYGWAILHYAARKSVQSQLPIVLDG